MKVLQINAYYGVGSTGNIVKDIETAGKLQGIDMYSIYWLLPNSEKESEKTFYLGKRVGKSSIAKIAEWIFQGGRLSYNKEITTNIIEKIIEINPDIIHLHNLHGDFEYGTLDLPLLFNALKSVQKKVIWTFHDCWPITGRCYHFEYKKCDKWKNGCGKCPQRIFDRQGIFYDYSNVNWKIKNKLYSNVEDITVVTVSNWLNGVVKESMLKNRKVITIYNGIDTEIFKPNKEPVNKRSIRILCIGWDRRKGFKDYYKLSKTLRDNEEIVVVGRRPLFRRLHKLPGNIKEIERVSNPQEMARVYNDADVYFNASSAETFGLTTVEAMSCGIPVVGYRTTATPEVIKNVPKGGQTVDKIQDVHNAIKFVSCDTTDYEKCHQVYCKENMLEKYITLYQGLIEEVEH